MHFLREVSPTSKTLMSGVGKWEGDTLSSAFKSWYGEKEVCDYKYLPIVVS